MPDSVIVTAAVSAAVAAVVSSLFKWGGQLAATVRQRFAPDHRPIGAGEWQLFSSFTDTERIRVLAVCAPTRSLRTHEVNPDAAVRFVRSQFPGQFPAEPSMSLPQSGVKFDGETTDSCVPYIWVWAAGRIDYCTFVTPATTSDGRLVLPILDVVTPVVALARAASSKSYREVFPRRWLELPRRLDWFIAVGSHPAG
ncbi:MAG: hypothetical protein JO246_01605 [Frankiaceae bacterium]|nr:hypothetical protein [Frankiaceae bacterium]MBV9869353.1 hypothetical protein [Frankiaceae bacterium]